MMNLYFRYRGPRCCVCSSALGETKYPSFGIHIVWCKNPICTRSWPHNASEHFVEEPKK